MLLDITIPFNCSLLEKFISMNKNISLKQQEIQESEYIIPYHYIPEKGDEGFSQTLFWSWGMRYFAGLELVLSKLDEFDFSSLIDIGCGDGRFLREVKSKFCDKRILGVDYSQVAISLAKALNPHIAFECLDISMNKVNMRFDIATLIEVLEHIPPEAVDIFLKSVKECIEIGGVLIITVPHKNRKLQSKHYQHFCSESLQEILLPHFQVEKIIPFDRISKMTSLFTIALGNLGRNYIITNKRLNKLLYQRVLNGCLSEQPEERCGRLLAILKKRDE